MRRITLGITCGDPNGIGLEVALRAFADARMFRYFRPVVFASAEMVSVHREACGLEEVAVLPARLRAGEHLAALGAAAEAGRAEGEDGEQTEDMGPAASAPHEQTDSADEPLDASVPELDEDDTEDADVDDEEAPREAIEVVTCWEHEPPVEFGRVSREAGEVASTSLEHATAALRDGLIDALVTAPIHKSAMQQAGFGFPGHTEYLEERFSAEGGRSLMLMVGDDGLRVAVATNHVPLKNVANSISPTILGNKIRLLAEALRRDFGLVGPRIAVLGLNPHAGDDGAIGTEEEQTIRPAVEAAKAQGLDIMGPYPADGFFGSGRWRDFDAVLAMYHDQGLIPFKTLAFGGGVNYTAGLTAVRTSPDHGTALDIAGQGRADAASMREACFLAREVVLLRAGYDEAHADPIRIEDRSLRRGRGGKRGGRERDGRGGGGKWGGQRGGGSGGGGHRASAKTGGGQAKGGKGRGKRDGDKPADWREQRDPPREATGSKAAQEGAVPPASEAPATAKTAQPPGAPRASEERPGEG